MSRKLKAISILAAALMLFSGCENSEERESTSYQDGLDYLWELQNYVANTGDTDVYLYLLEDMDRDYLLNFMEDYISEAYSDGWNDCEAEIEENREEAFWDGYYCGAIDGYDDGYADGSNGLPFNQEMVDQLMHGYLYHE